MLLLKTVHVLPHMSLLAVDGLLLETAFDDVKGVAVVNTSLLAVTEYGYGKLKNHAVP